MALSQEEKEIVSELKQKGKNPAEIAGYLGTLRSNASMPVDPEQPTQPTTTQPSQSFPRLRDMGSDIKETGTGIKDVIQRRGDKLGGILDAYGKGEQGALSTGFQTATNFLGGVGEVAGQALMGGLKMFTTPQQERDVKNVVTSGAEKFMAMPETKQWIQNMNDLKEENPEMARNIIATMEGGEYLLEFMGLSKAKDVVSGGVDVVGEGIDAGIDAAKRGTNKFKEALTPAKAAVQPVKSARARGVEELKDAYVKSFLGNNQKAILNKLDKHVQISSSAKRKFTIDELFEELANNGYQPTIKGELADMSGVLSDIGRRQDEIFDNLIPLLEKFREKIKIADLEKTILGRIKADSRFSLDYEKAIAEAKRSLNSLKSKYGDSISLADLQNAKVQAAKKSRAFKSELFEQDVSNVLDSTFAKTIDDAVPGGIYNEANARWGELERMYKTASILDNEKIGIGPLGGKVGQLGGAMLLGGAAFPVSGPGALVVAGISATYGGNQVAKFLRSLRFNPKKFASIVSDIQKDQQLIQKILDESSGIDKKFLEQTLLGPGTPLGTPKNPIITPAPTTFEKGVPKIDN
ncbi:MAG: hypothetical protein COU09_00120 [Candidatus Harrisonbacteria bacterium CG10_big_fil_rev_8_21_14_0_10_44_23]|uniref:Uncharacterized protein n=1 Tax=Candidatus Harrisonbacteria bacterium CG10_big_fil_rev_8_21_14_0_10_44_23 TaxID=1974585 RepID=A0A2H0UQV3_9BACT|nr:MAG: hypothetical protein COU09_00120 [Candidatus Harrisonbacteria bacterium CG10_big_fil_rev_8_21_14_0_10_44_23]